MKATRIRSCYSCGSDRGTWTKPCFYLNYDLEDNVLCGRCYMHIVVAGGRHIGDHIRGKRIPWIETKLGPDNHAWKGGRTVDIQGYIHLRSLNHPRAHNGYVKEHILVMEQHLGRYLKEGELVHHINHDKADNRIENLELMTPAEHMSHHSKGKIPWNKGLKMHAY